MNIGIMVTNGNNIDEDVKKRLETIIGILLNQSKFQQSTMVEKIMYLSSQKYDNKEIASMLGTTYSMVAKVKSEGKKGVNTTIGDYSQILGDFALLSKYDSIITLSTTSRQPSLDLIGINEESLDFLELKKKGAGSSTNEKHVKQLVEEKKVSYKIFDVDLPSNFLIEERIPKERIPKENIPKENIQKKEAQKTYPNAYEPWSESDDEFLKKFWKDESNKQSGNEKIQELIQKFGRNRGAIVSRLKKMGFDEF